MLGCCPQLQELDLSCSKWLVDLAAVNGASSLQELDVSCCTALVDISGLGSCKSLRRLNLRYHMSDSSLSHCSLSWFSCFCLLFFLCSRASCACRFSFSSCCCSRITQILGGRKGCAELIKCILTLSVGDSPQRHTSNRDELCVREC